MATDISGSLSHDHADKHNQLPDESKEQKQREDLAGIQGQHHEQQLRKELSMVAQDNDAKHGDVNSRCLPRGRQSQASE